MFEKLMNITSKVYEVAETKIDSYLLKSKMDAFDDIERQSIDFDDKEYENSQGWREKIGPVGFDFLKEIASSSIFTAISLRRINEIAAFCHPQRSKYDIGYAIKMRDENKEAGDTEKKEIKEIIEFINNTGYEKGREKITKQSRTLEEFVRLIVNDRLKYNQISFERVPFQYTKKGEFKLHSFYYTPSNSIKYAIPKKESKEALKSSVNPDYFKDPDKIKKRIDSFKDDDLYYVQVKEGRIINVFDHNELALIQGNLNGDLDNNGYCKGELELAINMISGHVFAETHNRVYFTQGFSNKGILVIKKKMARRDMDRFKQHFRQQMQGTSNAFRVPIVSNTEIQWVSFQADAKDMEWKEWMYYLIRLICACFQMSPQEINFDITRDTGPSLSDGGGRHREILSMFKETGIRPLLRWLANIINREIIRYYNSEYYKKYVFEFVGIDAEQRNDEIERLCKEIQNYKTVNEARKELDMEKIENGDIILNGAYLQYLGMKQQQSMMGGMPSYNDESEDENETEEESKGNEENQEEEKGETEKERKSGDIKDILTEREATKATVKLDNMLRKSKK